MLVLVLLLFKLLVLLISVFSLELLFSIFEVMSHILTVVSAEAEAQIARLLDRRIILCCLSLVLKGVDGDDNVDSTHGENGESGANATADTALL